MRAVGRKTSPLLFRATYSFFLPFLFLELFLDAGVWGALGVGGVYQWVVLAVR